MRHYDHTVNITWVMGHLNAARKYIDSGQGIAEATGEVIGKNTMHPKYQRRIFFPELWSEEELKNWGSENNFTHKNNILKRLSLLLIALLSLSSCNKEKV